MRNKADEQESVNDVECGVESRELEEWVVVATHHVGHYPADDVARWVEDDEHSHDTEHVEEHVSQCSTACLCIGRERSDEGCDGCTDVLTHCEGSSLLEAEARDVHAEEHEGDGHGGSRCLYEHGHERTHDDKDDDGEERVTRYVSQHSCHHVANIQCSGCVLEELQAHEEEGETEYEFSDALALRLAREYHRQTDGKQRNGKCRDVDFEADGRDDPCGDGSTDIGTHDHTD